MNWGSLLLLFAAPLVGSLLALFFRRQSEQNFSVVLSFSGAFLFAIVLMHLFPSVFRELNHAGFLVLAGFFLQMLLEQFTHGMEHGHFHARRTGSARITALIVGLIAHSLLDGFPVARFDAAAESHHEVLYGISLHKIPEGFALASVLIASGFGMAVTLLLAIVLAVAAPAAALIGNHIGQLHPETLWVLIALAVGSFLHVTTTVLFESEHPSHILSLKRLLAVLSGAAIALVI
ncbi:MAG: ZIP family metal transporter [Chitinophagales bacterium]|nr:ZIP family metal transporter [Chitinophagales bacterium]MDW8393206.1 ZIP family metal transporter [Chitinophagales bacterium]